MFLYSEMFQLNSPGPTAASLFAPPNPVVPAPAAVQGAAGLAKAAVLNHSNCLCGYPTLLTRFGRLFVFPPSPRTSGPLYFTPSGDPLSAVVTPAIDQPPRNIRCAKFPSCR